MRKITKFLMAGLMLLTCAVGLSNTRGEVKEAEAATDIAEGTKLYFKPNTNWYGGNARFAAYFYGTGDTWSDMVDENKDGIYEISTPKGTWTNVIFCRMNPDSFFNSWDVKWNQTSDLSYDGTNNLYIYPDGSNDWDKATGEWTKYESIYHGAESIDNSADVINNAIKFGAALPNINCKTSGSEYNVGFKFEFVESSTTNTITYNRIYCDFSKAHQGNERYAAYFFGNGEKWIDMKHTGDSKTYYVDVPMNTAGTAKNYPNVIFCRMSGTSTTNSWDNKWDKTGDLNNYSIGKKYTITSSWSGTWSTPTNYPTSKIEVIETTKTGYYTCANLNALSGYTGNESITYEPKTYFAVTITDIPNSFDGKVVKVTPAYQHDGSKRDITVFGETKEYMLDFTTSSEHITITLANA